VPEQTGDDFAFARQLFEDGRRVFRFDTFGDEAFWGEKMQLHSAISGEKRGGVGPGLSAKQALALGLKVDAQALPGPIIQAIKAGHLDLDKPETTLELLKLNAVLGVTGFFSASGQLTSLGIQCALCHSTVDDVLAPSIGRRQDGWPNRELDIGAIIALSPNLKPLEEALHTSGAMVKQVLQSWGPGKYDAELLLDGKGFRPDGKTGATLLPVAFGFAGLSLHTYAGWGAVPYWNAYVANTQMHGNGTFYDPRLNDPLRFPLAAKNGYADIRPKGEDRVTPKLAALHMYQVGLPVPKPPEGSYIPEAAKRGEALFLGKAQCARCHVPPLYTEPGWSMHPAGELGIDDFTASRSPNRAFYRTTSLRGLFTRMKGGFYHDGRFADLDAVITHYDALLSLKLATNEREELIEFLKSL
jgi:hypothetical protein